MIYRITFLALASLFLPLSGFCANGDVTTVGWSNVSAGRLYNTNKTTPLTVGTTAAGDGAVLQLGYYSQATTANNFAGTFIPLTGMGGANSAFATTSIGDGVNVNVVGGPAGRFNLSNTFTVGSPTSGNSLPATGTPLTIYFYNNTTIASSTAYGAVSSDTWTWVTPTNDGTARVDIVLDSGGSAAGFEFLGGDPGYYTNITVPEPSTWISAFVGGVVTLIACRKCLFRA